MSHTFKAADLFCVCQPFLVNVAHGNGAAGTKSDKVRQIGNAVPRGLAKAIVKAVLG